MCLIKKSNSLKALSHLADWLAGAIPEHKFVVFRGSVLVLQRNGITSLRMVVHRQDIVRTSATKLATCSKISAVALTERATGQQRQYNGSTPV